MGFGIWEWDGNGIWEWDGIWDWGGIMTNGMGWDGYGMGFDTNGNWDSPIPISMGGKYMCNTLMFGQLLAIALIKIPVFIVFASLFLYFQI